MYQYANLLGNRYIKISIWLKHRVILFQYSFELAY